MLPARLRSGHPVPRFLAGLATTVVVVGLGLATTAEAAPPGAVPTAPAMPAAAAGPGGFTSVAATRVLDTRTGVGAIRASVASGASVTAKVTGVGAVPASGVSAVVVTLIATESSATGYITGYASGGTRPTTSSVSFDAGDTVSNLAVLPVGGDGRIALYNGAPGSTHIVADVAGYFTSGTPGAGGFGSVTPTRVLDTRTALGAPDAPVAAGGTVTPRVVGTGGIPSSGVAAVVVNLTVTEAAQSGFVTGYPTGVGRPLASSVNFDAGRTAANLAVLPVGGDGRIALYNGAPGAAEFVADVSGYFMSGTPSVGGFGAVVPTRVLDTRLGQGAARSTVSGGSTVAVKVTGTAGVPSSGVASVVVNLTVTEPSTAGYIAGSASGSQRPATSNVNFAAKQTTSTLAVLPVGTDGRIALYNGAPGPTQLVADIAGYSLGDPVAPPAGGGASGCPVGQRNVAGGPDPWGGCFPGPGNAGVPAGTALTAYSGSLRITTPNTVIDAKTITGRLVIATSGVTITRSRISNGIENASGSRFTVTDSLILGATPDDKALDADHFTAERNEIKGGNSGGWCNDCILRNNWIHNDIRLPSNDSHHLSAYRMDQNGQFLHNTIACEASPTSAGGGCSGDLTGYGDFQTVQNNLVANNLFVASTNISYCSYGGNSGGKPYPNGNNVVFRDNVFQRGSNGKCGAYAPIGDFDPSQPGNSAVNNIWDDGSRLPDQQ